MDTEHDRVRLQIYALVSHIPLGKVSTYGLIAQAVEGASARLVGRVMGQLPSGTQLPWHRVVNASLKVSDHGNAPLQLEKLRQEGVLISNKGKIDRQSLWRP